mgnify:CR=1 FL=1
MKFQHAKVKPRNAWYEQKVPHSFLRAIHFVPSFVEGVLPTALLSFLNSRDRKVFGTVKLNHMDVGYLVRESQVESFIESLHSDPRCQRAMAVKASICFGIDEGHECFFFNTKTGRALLEVTLPASLKAFRLNRKIVRPTLVTIQDILGVEPVVPQRSFPAYPD